MGKKNTDRILDRRPTSMPEHLQRLTLKEDDKEENKI